MTDHVFGGMTRPATVGGVPQVVFAALLISTVFSILIPVAFKWSFIWSVGGIGFGVLGYMTSRIVCERDPNTFQYLKVKALFWSAAGGRRIGKGMVTYSRFPIRKR